MPAVLVTGPLLCRTRRTIIIMYIVNNNNNGNKIYSLLPVEVYQYIISHNRCNVTKKCSTFCIPFVHNTTTAFRQFLSGRQDKTTIQVQTSYQTDSCNLLTRKITTTDLISDFYKKIAIKLYYSAIMIKKSQV